jgi:cyclopropane-fatty-acyl-phospholipid synthase
MKAFSKEKQIVSELLALAGVDINGNQPWDVEVHNEACYKRVLAEGILGLGETYMEGMWDCQALDQFFYKVASAHLDEKVKINFKLVAYYLKNKLLNLQTKSKAFTLKHYDTGNDLFMKMLDKRMAYTCGYWDKADNLDAAQEAKLDLVCRKVGLRPGMKVLDIGCGWGSFMKYACEKYGVSCVGITISQAQMDLGQKICQGLPIEFRLQDYRDLKGQYDAVVSIGMFEAVGYKNYRIYMKTVSRCLKEGGLFLLHTIGSNHSDSLKTVDPWTRKYIFTQGALPSIKQIGQSIEELFVMEDWHNFGSDYDKTLMAWNANFQKHWPELQNNYSETFHRMWQYYLLLCAGSFRARSIQLWQIVLSKQGLAGGFKTIR